MKLRQAIHIGKRYSAACDARWLRRLWWMPQFRRYAPSNAKIREILIERYSWAAQGAGREGGAP